MKEKIASNSFLSMIILSIISSSIGISMYTVIKTSSIDCYISILIGELLGLIPLFIFIYIFNNYEDLSIKEKNILVFNKILGTIINIILFIIFFIISGTIIFNLGNFIVSQYLSETPLLLIMVVLGITIAYTINKGIETISRVSSIFIVIVFILFIFSFCYLFNEANINNLKPFLEYGLNNPIKGGIINSIITTSPLYALLIIPKNKVIGKTGITKKIILSYLISSSIIFLISLLSTSILGKYLLNIYQYPGYISIKKISIFSFIDRIENFMSLHWILSCFITISITTYYLSGSIKKVSNKIVNYLLVILIILISFFYFKNNTYFTHYIYYTYPYISLILLIIHFIILIKIYMYKKRN